LKNHFTISPLLQKRKLIQKTDKKYREFLCGFSRDRDGKYESNSSLAVWVFLLGFDLSGLFAIAIYAYIDLTFDMVKPIGF